jgi:cytochrome c oxidase subunit 2
MLSAVGLLLGSFHALAADQAPAPAANEQVIKITAKRFEYSPNVITLKLNVPAVLELTTLDRVHGFAAPDLKLQAEIKPGEVTRVRFVPDKVGTFPFHCDQFCGSGHEDMNGQIVVTK